MLMWSGKPRKKHKIKNVNPYLLLDPNITPDHNAEISGKILEVEKDIEKDRKIDPVKVFNGYSGKKPKKKLDILNDKNKKKNIDNGKKYY